MPECHKCQYDKKGSNECLNCRGPSEVNHHGRVHVSINSGTDPQTGAEVEASLMVADHEAPADTICLSECCSDTARRLMGFLLALSERDLILVSWMTSGKSLAEFGRAHHVSRAAASRRYKMMCRRMPILKTVFGCSWRPTDSGINKG